MMIKAKKKDTERSIERKKEEERVKNDLYRYTASYNASITFFHGDEHQS